MRRTESAGGGPTMGLWAREQRLRASDSAVDAYLPPPPKGMLTRFLDRFTQGLATQQASSPGDDGSDVFLPIPSTFVDRVADKLAAKVVAGTAERAAARGESDVFI